MGTFSLYSENTAREMAAALTRDIRAGLKEKIMAEVEKEVDTAVDEAVKNFSITIQSLADTYHANMIVKVILEHKDGKA